MAYGNAKGRDSAPAVEGVKAGLGCVVRHCLLLYLGRHAPGKLTTGNPGFSLSPMVRLFCFLSALVMASASVWLSVRGAEGLLLFLQAHPIPKWFGHSFGLYSSIFASWIPIMIAMKSRGSKPDEDASLTPRVRRLPSGLREL